MKRACIATARFLPESWSAPHLPRRCLAAAAIALVVFTMCLQGGKPESEAVRKAKFAGMFYPANSTDLDKVVSYLLQNLSREDIDDVRALIVPHAGYGFSGYVAATAYRQIEGRHFDAVVVIGNSHREPFDGIAVFNGTHYETPLGRVEVDTALADRLVESSNRIFYSDVEANEHSVEVQVPFLQKTIAEDLKIVPILMGSQSMEDAQLLSDAILNNAGANTLIVASSDMSHYYGYDETQKLDSRCLGLESRLDDSRLYYAIARGYCELDGYGAVLTAIITAKKLGSQIKILDYGTSGDVPGGNASRVVGYGSAVIYGRGRYSGEERKELLDVARASIKSYTESGTVPDFNVSTEKLAKNMPAFVTIIEGGKLRGSVGTTSNAKPLYIAVRDAAISAAINDSRFPPLSLEELDKIKLEISVPSTIRPLFDERGLIIGRHGLIAVQGDNFGVLLPQAATGLLLDRRAFLEQVCEVAGLDKNCWKEGAGIYTFDAEVFGDL